jgi:hypothetical protein
MPRCHLKMRAVTLLGLIQITRRLAKTFKEHLVMNPFSEKLKTKTKSVEYFEPTLGETPFKGIYNP